MTAVPAFHMVSSLSSVSVKYPLCYGAYLVSKVFSVALLRKYVKLSLHMLHCSNTCALHLHQVIRSTWRVIFFSSH